MVEKEFNFWEASEQKKKAMEELKKSAKLTPDDFLQPTDKRFKEVYGYDPIAQGEVRKKEMAIEMICGKCKKLK